MTLVIPSVNQNTLDMSREHILFNLCIFVLFLQIDHSIVESFGGEGKACIIARVYPTNLEVDGATHLYVFNNGSNSIDISKLTAWTMKTAQIN